MPSSRSFLFAASAVLALLVLAQANSLDSSSASGGECGGDGQGSCPSAAAGGNALLQGGLRSTLVTPSRLVRYAASQAPHDDAVAPAAAPAAGGAAGHGAAEGSADENGAADTAAETGNGADGSEPAAEHVADAGHGNHSEHGTHFDCEEEVNKRQEAWSVEKLDWCCLHAEVGCPEPEAVYPHGVADGHAVYDVEEPLLELAVRVHTAASSLDRYGGTDTGAQVAFLIGDTWTEDLLLCNSSGSGSTVQRRVRLPAWPTKIRLKAMGNDSWLIDNVVLRVTNNGTGKHVDVPVLTFNEANDSLAYGNFTRFWLDSDEEAPAQQIYPVPPMPASAESIEAARHGCATRVDSRAEAIGYDTAVPGSPCVFGLDARDEGKHCVVDETYGSFGWCYTDADMETFGACNEACPLFGPDKILATKLDEVLRRLDHAEGEGHEAAAAAGTAAAGAKAPAAAAAGTAAAGAKAAAPAPAAKGGKR